MYSMDDSQKIQKAPKGPRRIMAPIAPYDRWLVLTAVGLLLFGLLMVTSASIVVSDHRFHQPLHYFYRQLVHLLFGVSLGCIIVQFEIAWWEKIGGMFLVFVMLLLALVLLPGIGHTVNGSARWIGIGPLGMQVSELAKLAIVIYMAGYLVRRNTEVQTSLLGFIKPMALLGVMAILLLREPDFGAMVVVMITALGMMFLAGMRIQHFVFLFLLIFLACALLAISEPYRLLRLTSFVNPWSNPYGSGYQLTQSLIAFGRGGLFGVGLGNSIQKLFYLPEAHTDFLFAVIAEELGLVGVIILVALFTFLVARIFIIGREAQRLGQHFAGFMAYGFALWIAIQFMVSVGVNTGVLPTKGLTLPLLSYGGSSMLISCVALALLLRIDYENRMIKLGLR